MTPGENTKVTRMRVHTHTHPPPRKKRRKTHRANKTIIESCNQEELLAMSLCLTHCQISGVLSHLPERQQQMMRGVRWVPHFLLLIIRPSLGIYSCVGFWHPSGQIFLPLFPGFSGSVPFLCHHLCSRVFFRKRK